MTYREKAQVLDDPSPDLFPQGVPDPFLKPDFDAVEHGRFRVT